METATQETENTVENKPQAMENYLYKMPIEKITIKEPFSGLFTIEKPLLDSIIKSMIEEGFDGAKPLIVWVNGDTKEYILVDGHTRLQAAKSVGTVCTIPAVFKQFADEDEAYEYAIRCQTNRRNLTDALILAAVERLGRRGRGRIVNPSDDGFEKPAPTSKELAEKLGVSESKIERIKKVMDNASPEILDAVKSGEKSINAASEEIRKARQADQTPEIPLSSPETPLFDEVTPVPAVQASPVIPTPTAVEELAAGLVDLRNVDTADKVDFLAAEIYHYVTKINLNLLIKKLTLLRL